MGEEINNGEANVQRPLWLIYVTDAKTAICWLCHLGRFLNVSEVLLLHSLMGGKYLGCLLKIKIKNLSPRISNTFMCVFSPFSFLLEKVNGSSPLLESLKLGQEALSGIFSPSHLFNPDLKHIILICLLLSFSKTENRKK